MPQTTGIRQKDNCTDKKITVLLIRKINFRSISTVHENNFCSLYLFVKPNH